MVKDNPSNSPRVSPLLHEDQILCEVRRLYRAGRRGDIETQDMTRFVSVLEVLMGMKRDIDLEKRIKRLEEGKA